MFFKSNPAEQAWLELPDGSTFWLPPRCTIGRQVGNDLVLKDDTLSRQHALITIGPEGYTLADARSRNGTFARGERVARPVVLRDGDEIRLGTVRLRFRCRRRMELPDDETLAGRTTRVQPLVRTHECWLLAADVDGFKKIMAAEGSEAALNRLQTWIGGLRPLVEQCGGRMNRQVSDAILAYWRCDSTKPAEVVRALQEIEKWRPSSPLPFRSLVHHGQVLFSSSEQGEELSGREVSLLFQMDKIARGFGTNVMLSEAAVRMLEIEERCEAFGRSAVDGMTDFFTFYGLPAEFRGTAK